MLGQRREIAAATMCGSAIRAPETAMAMLRKGLTRLSLKTARNRPTNRTKSPHKTSARASQPIGAGVKDT